MWDDGGQALATATSSPTLGRVRQTGSGSDALAQREGQRVLGLAVWLAPGGGQSTGSEWSKLFLTLGLHSGLMLQSAFSI